MQTNELLPSVCQFISEIEKKSSVFQCSFYQNFNFTAVKISFLKQFRELTNDTMMWDNINWQCRWNQTCEEAIWCMETIPVIRRLQPRKFHESHLQSILPAEAPTSSTTTAVALTSCTTAAVAPTSSTTPPEALTSSTKPPEAVSPCIAAGHDDAKPDGDGHIVCSQYEDQNQGSTTQRAIPPVLIYPRYGWPWAIRINQILLLLQLLQIKVQVSWILSNSPISFFDFYFNHCRYQIFHFASDWKWANGRSSSSQKEMTKAML